MKQLIAICAFLFSCSCMAALSTAEQETLKSNLNSLTSSLQNNANTRKFLKTIKAKSVNFKAITNEISRSNYGAIEIVMNVKTELPEHAETAKLLIETIIDKYKADTKQDVLFQISARVYADTKIEQVKHYYARAKYIPEIAPMVQIESKDLLVSIE